MNVSRFFERWSILEDPFRAEEARQDAVFSRVREAVGHPDLEKIAGDLDRPATSIVFGEKGSGKTAIRLQIERRIAQHNAAHPDRRTLLVPYDDLNPVLDRLKDRLSRGERRADPADLFQRVRLVDHMDGVLAAAVTPIVSEVLGSGEGLGGHAAFLAGRRRELRRLPRDLRVDALLLQAVYDASEAAAERTVAFRKALRAPHDRTGLLWTVLAALAWLLPLGVVALWWRFGGRETGGPWLWALGAAVLLALAATAKRILWDPLVLRRLARRILQHAPALARTRESLADSLAVLPPALRSPRALPAGPSDEQRYAMFDRLRRLLASQGCTSVVIVVDRVDEPTLVSGDAARMQALVWPLLNNKFLQMDGFGLKLLLPIELRYALFRESNVFFQEARLDKQNLIERLNWSGATLYDLCNARLQACLAPGAPPTTLRDLFEDDVSRQDLVDALDQMRRPRDAFKLLYRCIQEHCSNSTDEDPRWKIPRLVLDGVRKREQERVEQLNRGVRPA